MSRYKDKIECFDIRMTEDEFKNMYSSLLFGTKFELSKKMDTKKKCHRYELTFKAFYYDTSESRKYLLTNDERRKLLPTIETLYPNICENVSSNATNNATSPATIVKDQNRIMSSNLERLSSLVMIGSEIDLDGFIWKVLDRLEDGTYLVTTKMKGLIDSFSGLIDSMIDETGEELLDRVDNSIPIMRIIRATCGAQQFIRRAFPYIDRIWDSGRITSTGRCEKKFRERYLKITENKLVTVRLYNVIASHEKKLYLRYSYKW
jgi:hypothetical protein